MVENTYLESTRRFDRRPFTATRQLLQIKLSKKLCSHVLRERQLTKNTVLDLRKHVYACFNGWHLRNGEFLQSSKKDILAHMNVLYVSAVP